MIEKLGHYKIVSELGRGGMGVVYKAYEESLKRHVAIKVLSEHLSDDESFVERFVREARAIAGLSHPNIIQIFSIGRETPADPSPLGPGTCHYFVMEFVEGRSVHDLLKQEGAIEPMQAVRVVHQAACGLAAAHDHGLVHRDIKPGNLLVTKDGRVKIADFGLALAPTDGASRLTATNSLVGTPGYLSPEQCCGEPAGPRSDLYSLGMTFYEMLTGSMPFKGESPLAVLRQVLDEEPPPLLQVNPTLDPRIARVVERMVAKEPGDRYQTCHEVLADLDEVLGTTGASSSPSTVRPAGLPAAPVSHSPSAAWAPTQQVTRISPAPSPRNTVQPAASSRAAAASPGGAAAAGAVSAAPAGKPAVGVPPPLPPVPGGAAAAAPAAVPAVAPVVAANAAARRGMGGRWLVIAAMAVLLVIAVSAAGLFLAVPMLKDAPFLRDAPFLKDASFLKDIAGKAASAAESTADSAAASEEKAAPWVENDDREAGTFETAARSTSDRPPSDSTSAQRSDPPPSIPASSDAGTLSPPARVASADAGAGTAGAARGEVPSSPAGAGRVASSSSPTGEVARGVAAAPAHPAGARSPAAPAPREPEVPPPPPRRAAVREHPQVAVVAVGEPRFAGAAEEALESQLMRHGLDLYDERGILELRDAGGGSRLAPSSLVEIVAGRGVDVLVLIDVEPLGERELDALGRYAYATTSRVRVDVYLAAVGDGIGRGWSEEVEYAGPNTASKADASMGNVSTAVAEAIDAAWGEYRAAAR